MIAGAPDVSSTAVADVRQETDHDTKHEAGRQNYRGLGGRYRELHANPGLFVRVKVEFWNVEAMAAW